MIKSNILKTL